MFNIFHMEKKEDAGIITKPLENIMTCEYNVQFKIAYSLMNEPVGLCLGLEIRILIKNIPMKTTFLFDSMIAMVTTFLSPQCIFFLPPILSQTGWPPRHQCPQLRPEHSIRRPREYALRKPRKHPRSRVRDLPADRHDLLRGKGRAPPPDHRSVAPRLFLRVPPLGPAS